MSQATNCIADLEPAHDELSMFRKGDLMTDRTEGAQGNDQQPRNGQDIMDQDPSGMDTSMMDAFPLSIAISDPNLPDNPLVYVNGAFTELTGYSSSSACGRNCRFLQGENTENTPVRELADAVNAGESAAVEIVNYTADGKPFLNHLVITPVREEGQDAKTLFYIGIQTSDGAVDLDPALAKRVRARIEDASSSIRDPLESVLRILRAEMPASARPSDVVTLLSSRIDCLAQLYAGVFQRNGMDKEGRTRLGAYLGRVCSGTHLSDRSYNVRLSTDFIECTVEVETAAMIGLLLSELLANAFDRSNPYDNEAHIEVVLDWVDGQGPDGNGEGKHARLTVRDTSEGRKRSLLPRKDTVGRRIVDTFKPRLHTVYAEQNTEDRLEATLDFPTVRRQAMA